jgi:hypothetical protein
VVRHDDVALALASAPELRGVQLRVEHSPEMLEDFARDFLGTFGSAAMWPPAGRCEEWEGWDLPRDTIADLFAAAARYYEAGPWRWLANEQTPMVRLASGEVWTVMVMGAGGAQFGLALYSSAADVQAMVEAEIPETAFERIRGQMVSVSFGPMSDLTPRARRELAFARWPLAGPAAYPELMTVNTPGGGVSRQAARALTATLDSLPRFVETYADAFTNEWDTGAPLDTIEWTDEQTGSVFRYHGITRRVPSVLDADARREMREILEEAARDGSEDDSPADFLARANRRLQAHMDVVNARPRADLHGFAPRQVERLLRADWNDSDGPVRLRRDLTPANVEGANVTRHVRALLELAIQQGGLGRTQAGNHEVAVVRELMAGTELADRWAREGGRRLREHEVWPVHQARVLAHLAGLLRPAGTRWMVTRRGRDLTATARAGELFALLFDACFRKLNLAYPHYAEWPELQYQVTFTLVRLGEVARDWRSGDELLDEVVLPYALERKPSIRYSADAGWLLEGHILRRLCDFGLMERSASDRPRRYRVTPLFDRFLGFDIGTRHDAITGAD